MDTLNPGRYQARLVRWELYESPKSASMGITFTAACTHYPGTNGEWVEINPPYPEVIGTHWIVDKQGQTRHDAVEHLKLATGWDGTFDMIDGTTHWEPLPVEIVVGLDKYDGKERMRIEWINPLNAPVGPKPLSDATRARLRCKFLNAMTKPLPPPPGSPLTGDSIPF